MRSQTRGLLALLTVLVAPAIPAQTLLEVHEAERTLDFVDPGSGRKLASVDIAAGLRRVAVAPDGKLAAVLSCSEPSASSTRPFIDVTIVDLEHPQVVRRLALARAVCPDSLTWPAPDRIVIAEGPDSPMDAIDPVSGANVGPWSESNRAVAARADDGRPPIDVTTIAVQRFLASGGDLRRLATTPVIPHAVCHACTPEP